MAKKKLSHQQPHEVDAPHSLTHQPLNVDDPSAQFQNLKELNNKLVRQTSDSRHQIESLLQDKASLESAFGRSTMEKKDLQFQLFQAADDIFTLDVEKAVYCVFLETHLKEIGVKFDTLIGEKNDLQCAKAERESEIEILNEDLKKLSARLENERDQLNRLSLERDEMKKNFDVLASEASLLKLKILEAEEKENVLGNEVEKLRAEGEKLKEEKDEKEGAIRELMTERDFALRNSAESATLIEKLKGEIDGIMRDKNEVAEQKIVQESKISALQLELKKLDEDLKSSLDEEALLRSNILQYEKALARAVEKEQKMDEQIRGLLKEKKVYEQNVIKLAEERDSLQNVRDMVQKELKERQRSIDEAIRAKDEIEQEKLNRENEIVELRRQVDEFRDAMDELKKSCSDLKEKNKQLLSEVDRYRNAAEEAVVERDNFRKGFEEEQDKVKNLILQVSRMEDRLDQAAAELGQMRNEREKLIEKNKIVEDHADILMKEKEVLQKGLVEIQRGSTFLRAKVESSNQTLAELKNIAAFVCHSNTEESAEEVVSMGNGDEDIASYAEKLAAIKNAFKNKDKMMEDMKQQLVSLQNSTVEAQKSKNFWTVISSATTILAAAFAAYAARGR